MCSVGHDCGDHFRQVTSRPDRAPVLTHTTVVLQTMYHCHFSLSTVVANNLLLVDEIMKAGMSSLKPGQE